MNNFSIACSIVLIHSDFILVCKHSQHFYAICPRDDSYTNVVYIPVT